MTTGLNGQVAIVTGSARGIGRGFAEILLEKGVKVCISDIDVDQGITTEKELQQKHGGVHVMFRKCDVAEEDGIENLIKDTKSCFGRVDIFVNNAGAAWENRFEMMINVNLVAVYRGTMLAIKHMGKDNGGQGGVVVNVASIGGMLPLNLNPLYCLTKFGVLGFTRSIGAISPKIHGVRVNAICPTFVDTEFIKFKPEDLAAGKLYRTDVDYDDRFGFVFDNICKKSTLTVREVAERLLPLVTDESLSGAAMVVSPEGSGVASQLPTTIDDVLDLVPDRI